MSESSAKRYTHRDSNDTQISIKANLMKMLTKYSKPDLSKKVTITFTDNIGCKIEVPIPFGQEDALCF